MRRLTISFHVTVANYEYLVYWRLYQDGNIECEIRATGIMVTTALRPGETAPGTIVDTGTYAPFHQHFIVARLDLDVDGPLNTVHAVSSEAAGDDPWGLGLVVRETPLRTEAEGKQDYDWASQRAWKVVSSDARNGLGSATGYKLVPGGAFPPLLSPSAPAFQRAEVIGHTLWVTPYRADERWPCGAYPTQSEFDHGMTEWIADGASLENTLVVGGAGFLNPARFPNEPARHKVLDLLGDLALLGGAIHGFVIAVRAGHSLHVALANALSAQEG